MDGVVHFEIPSGDKERAGKFYGEVFGWSFVDMPEMNYKIARSGEVDENNMMKEKGVINGGIFDRGDGPVKSTTIIMNVESIDETLEKIKRAGGEIVKEKIKVGEMGYVAYFKDTEGNINGIWENIRK